MATATILPQGRTTFLDANSNPLSGGQVFFYVPPNTTTLKTTWQDAGELIPNSNPVILDGNGSALIYGSGQYLMEVYDSLSNLVWTALTQDLLSLVQTNNNTFSGNNTFTGTNTFTNTVSLGSAASATTQTAGDNSTLVATDQFVNTAVASAGTGGFVSKVRNGTYDSSQRGSGGTITAGSPAYTLDGWIVGCVGANVTWGQVQLNAGGCYYGLGITGNTSVTDVFMRQRIESLWAQELIDLPAGATPNVTFQVKFYNNTGSTIVPTLTIKHAATKDSWGAPVTDVNAVALQSCPSGMYTTLAYTFTPSSSSYNGLEITVDLATSLNSPSNIVYFVAADIRSTPTATVGLNSLPPTPELRNIAVELPINKRYLQSYNAPSASQLIMPAVGTSTGVNQYQFNYQLQNTMRTAPTGITVSAISDFCVFNIDHFTGNLATLVFSGATTDNVSFTATCSAGAGSNNNFAWLASQSATAQLLFTGAEL